MIHGIVASVVLAGAVVSLAIGTIIAWRHRPEPGATWLVATLACAMAWTLLVGVNALVTGEVLSRHVHGLKLTVTHVLPICWIGFALAYTGRSRWISLPIFSTLAIVPAAIAGSLLIDAGLGTGLVRTNVWVGHIDSLAITGVAYGPVGYFATTISYLIMVVGIALLLELTLDAHTRYQLQGSLLILAAAIPMLANAVGFAGITPVEGMDTTPYAFVITGALVVLAMQSYRLLEAVPVPTRIAHEAILESLESPLVVLDAEGAIVHMNPEVAVFLDDGIDQLDGAPATVLPGVSALENGAPSTDSFVEVMTDAAGRREFELSVSPLTDHHGRRYGDILLYQDLTDHRNRERRLNVLNRVLRHDIRNEMNIVLGAVEQARTEAPDLAPQFDLIEATADSIVKTSETARQIEYLVDAAGNGAPAGSLATVIDRLADRFAAVHPEMTIQMTDPPSVTVPVGLERVLWELLDNAAVHGNSEDGRIDLAFARRADDRLECAVSDDGPGIPSAELAVYGHAEVSALEHANGLGLWLVHLVIDELGGTVSVSSDGSGTTVTVDVPVSA